MPKQDADVVDDVVSQDTPEQALAAQKDGFTEAETSTPVPATTEKSAEQIQNEAEASAKAEQEAETARVAAEAAEAAAKANTPVLAGYTEAQVKEMLERSKQFDNLQASLNKVNGKFGGIEQKLKELAESKSSGVQLTEDDVDDLKKEYGPELAAALLKTLNKFGAKLGSAAAPAKDTRTDAEKAAAELARISEAVELARKEAKQEVETKLGAVERKTELKFLTREHKDWRTLIQGEPMKNPDGTVMADADGNPIMGLKPEFTAWVKTLPQAEQDKLNNSWDADFLSDKIGEYKKRITTQQAATAAVKKQQTTPARLAGAVTQKGVPGVVTVKTALEEQREGYLSA